MEVAKRPRAPDGKFGPGQPTPVCAGRKPKGRPNKLARDVKAGILDAAIAHGSDGEGAGGLQGFFAFLIKNDLRAFTGLVARLVPMKLTADVDATSFSSTATINVVSIPEGRYLTKDAIEELSLSVYSSPDPKLVVIDSTAAEVNSAAEASEEEPAPG